MRWGCRVFWQCLISIRNSLFSIFAIIHTWLSGFNWGMVISKAVLVFNWKGRIFKKLQMWWHILVEKTDKFNVWISICLITTNYGDQVHHLIWMWSQRSVSKVLKTAGLLSISPSTTHKTIFSYLDQLHAGRVVNFTCYSFMKRTLTLSNNNARKDSPICS